MALLQVALQTVEYPLCIDGLPSDRERECAREIYEAYVSVKDIWAKNYEDPDLSPCTQIRPITERLARYIVSSVFEKRALPHVSKYNTDRVRFVGCAAGALEAINVFEYDPLTTSRFNETLTDFVSALSQGDIIPLHKKYWRGIMFRLFGVADGRVDFCVGCGVWAIVRRDGDTTEILSFRMVKFDHFGRAFKRDS